MEKSVKNAVFKGFPVLMESDTFGSKQNSQTTNKETNNSLSSFFRVYYLVSKCMGKRVADQSAIDTALGKTANKKSPSSCQNKLLKAAKLSSKTKIFQGRHFTPPEFWPGLFHSSY